MKLSKKLLLGFGTITSVAAPIAAVVSCGTDQYGTNWEMASHRDIQTFLTSPDGTSMWYGVKLKEMAPLIWADQTVLEESTNGEMVGLFRKNKLGYDKFKKVHGVDADGNPTTEIDSSPNRETSLSFELIDSVTFQYKNDAHEGFDGSTSVSDVTVSGQEKVFDSDTTDTSDSKYNRSINSPDFLKTVEAGGFVRIKFHMSSEAKTHHWIEQETGKKMSTFKASDFFTALMLKNASNSGKSRYNDGGSEELDAWANKESGAANDEFTIPKATTPLSQYQSQLVSLGMYKDQFSFKNKSTVIPDEDTFQLNFNGTGAGNKLKSFWKTNFIKGQNIGAYPTDEVAASIAKVKVPSNLDTPEFRKSDTYLSGVYQVYSRNAANHQVGGQYYVSANTKQKLTMHINEDYVDQVYINEKNKNGGRTHINTYTTNFIQESDLSDTIIAQGFKQGFTASASIKGFSKSEMLEAMKDPEKYGLTFSTGYTSSKQLGDYTVQQLIPLISSPVKFDEDDKPVAGTAKSKVYYNDNYAKVMWGAKISDLRSGATTAGEAFKTLFDGSGLEFRTALQAAINTYSAVQEWRSTSQEWTNWFAPEGPIANKYGGSPFLPTHPEAVDSDASIPTPDTKAQIKAALTRITSKFTAEVDADGKISTTEHTRQSYVDTYTSATSSAIAKYTAQQFAKVKALMSKALDDAGLKHGVSADEVLWEFSYGRGMLTDSMNLVYEQLRKMINSLDDRLHLVAKVNGGTEDGTVKATVATEEITTDERMVAPGTNGVKYWLERLFAYGHGENAGSLNPFSSYTVDSPASPIFENIGYLQTGILTGLSFYSDNKALMTDDNHLSGLKPLIKALKDNLDSGKTKWGNQFDALESGINDPKEKAKIEIVKTALAGLDFNKIHNSKITDISNYDYFGFAGLEAIKKLKETDPETADSDSGVAKAISLANDLINSWFQDAKYSLDSWMTDANTDPVKIMDSMTAFSIIAPWTLNPFDAYMGNREYPGTEFEKNWFFTGTDDSAETSIDYMRVDLDETKGS